MLLHCCVELGGSWCPGLGTVSVVAQAILWKTPGAFILECCSCLSPLFVGEGVCTCVWLHTLHAALSYTE